MEKVLLRRLSEVSRHETTELYVRRLQKILCPQHAMSSRPGSASERASRRRHQPQSTLPLWQRQEVQKMLWIVETTFTMTIRFENVWFAYESFAAPGNQPKPQLQDISFEIRAEESVGLAGRSGSGKTTLMQMFNGLLPPGRGRIFVDGLDIYASDYDITALRRRLGVVFQFPEMHLFAATVEEEIAFGPQQQHLPSAEIAKRVTLALHQVGLDKFFSGRNPFTLSQGEKRRVALAGALAMQPEMLVLDEPTASLDARGALEVRRLLRDWQAAGKTLVIISHDIDLLARLCPRLLILGEGRLIYDGPTASLWEMVGPNSAQDRLSQAGLAWPRYQRLRQLLPSRGISWQGIPILKDGQDP